ncbi:MAG: hypothetical protein DHS20C20_00070 [Ardenticatenaceae bacterium]|nr:MAG: hypothetical protein DHS20C20_00070 [Ardenticatenaceae bacterium]
MGTVQPPKLDPEVLPQAKRRTFMAAYRLCLLEEADKCHEQPGQIGTFLRRDGLYSSYLTTWRRQQEASQMKGLKPRKRGCKANAELIIEAQKKLSEILGITLETTKDEDNLGQP